MSQDLFKSNQDDLIQEIVDRALSEDVGWTSGGYDVTTNSTIPENVTVEARFLAKADGVLAGLSVADRVFRTVDSELKTTWNASDGDVVTNGTYFGSVIGNARSLLVAERIVLNLMQRMSGVATATRKMVDRVKEVGGKSRVLDTRKTIPGLRVLDKLAVKIGGGTNHRFGLHDMVMIKDNHIEAAGGIKKAVARVKEFLSSNNRTNVRIEVETRNFDEVREVIALEDGIDRVMLDNMVKKTDTGVDVSMLQEAVAMINGKYETEASGNVTLSTIGEIAKTGVDYISSGALTHSVMALDISLKMKISTNDDETHGAKKRQKI